jgi:hypothetical protein
MFRKSLLAAALAATFSAGATLSGSAIAADDRALAQIRDEIRQMKSAYEARIQALESRLQQAEAQAKAQAEFQASSQANTQAKLQAGAGAAEAAPAVVAAPMETAPAPAPAVASSNTFNPSISLILGGTFTNLSQDPNAYRLQGFIPGGEIGPGARSFNLGESELTLAANIDTNFTGRLTFSLAGDNSASVEEAFAETLGLSNGVNLRAGRFLSGIGYLNSQHAHAWDFVDAPLAYQAFLGGQYKTDGVQARWLAPTDIFLELGAELGNGVAFPGNDRNKNGAGSAAVFAHAGDDIGDSGSWRAGLSYLHTGAHARAYEDFNALSQSVSNTFSGTSNTLIVDGIYKWAPGGNGTHTNVKLQGEYFRRTEDGSLASDGIGSGGYASTQSGWYLQGVYQFSPTWRFGVRHDSLTSGTPNIGLVNSGVLSMADFSRLASFNARRNSLMFDYNPSEFSRFRLQFARDASRPEAVDNQIFLQYIMSLGAHGAHSF